MITEDNKKSSTPETTIIIKNSQTPGNKPSSENLEPGELGLTLCKGEEDIWTKNASGEIINLRSPRHDLIWGNLFFRYKTKEEYEGNKNNIPETAITYIENPGIIIIDGISFTDYSSLQSKVDKIEGKGLSTEDFTTVLKEKLIGLENYNDTDVRKLISTVTSKNIEQDEAIGTKVDKINGKGLSTEDFTTVLKEKLIGLENYSDTELVGKVNNLQNQLNTLVSGNVDVAIESFNEVIKFLEGLEDTQSLSNIISNLENQINTVDKKIPTKNSQIENDSGFLVKKDISHLASTEEVNKCITSTIEEYDIPEVTETLVTEALRKTPQSLTESEKKQISINLDFPTNSDINRIVEDNTNSYIELKNTINDVRLEKVDRVEGKGLSTEDFTTAEKNKLIGLENYNDTGIRKSIENINTKNLDQDRIIGTKVDKVIGKGLSTEDFTTVLKEKLIGLENYNDTDIKKSIENINTKNQEQDRIIETKVDKIDGKGLSTNDYTTTEKNKLIGLENYNDTGIKNSIKNLEEKIVIDELGKNPENLNTDIYFDLSGDNEFSGVLVPEAPQDSKSYVRKNGAWYEYPEKSIIESKVTKVPGKDLSTNDYTTVEKNQLGNLVTTDIPNVKSNIETLKTGQGTLVSDMSTVKNDINNLKTELGILNEDLTKILEN